MELKHTLLYWSEDNAYNNEEGQTLTDSQIEEAS